MNILESADIITAERRKLLDCKSKLGSELSKCDINVNNFYHAIEQSNLSASEFTKLCYRFKKYLQYRRTIKEQMTNIDLALNNRNSEHIKQKEDKRAERYKTMNKESLNIIYKIN